MLRPAILASAAVVLSLSLPVRVVLHVPAPGTADSPPVRADPGEYERVYQAVVNLGPDATQGALVTDLVIERDAGRWTLSSGEVFLLTPVEGRTIGAVFVGKGTFAFTPSTTVEREALRRRLDAPTLESPLTSVLFLAVDGTVDELQAALSFVPREVPKAAADVYKRIRRYVVDEDRKLIDVSLMATLLNGEANGWFAAFVGGGKEDPLIFRIDPFEGEEVTLQGKSKARRAGDRLDIICRFRPDGATADPTALTDERWNRFDITSYEIEGSIATNLDFSATATVTLAAHAAGQRWLPLWLYSELEVTSAELADGTSISAVRAKKNPVVWLRLPDGIEAGDTVGVRLTYEGDLFERVDDWFFLKSSTGWYPRYAQYDAALFDLTFRTPARFTFVSSGDLLTTEEVKGTVTSRWSVSQPEWHMSFNIGKFEPFDLNYPGIPHTTVYMSPSAHADLNTRFLSGAGMRERVAEDVTNSLIFFQDVFGPPRGERFRATEIPFSHGQAFPSMVHLSWYTFHEDRKPGMDQFFRAHEMAHQWWGLDVGWKTDRDMWISEGFATYAGLWYLDVVLKEHKAYRDLLDDWRKEIARRRTKAGPVSLGTRNIDPEDEETYQTIVYYKGAWVLHMLRGMMASASEDPDARFRALMREFYAKYRGRTASTADFRELVERHLAMDMRWFFDQWIHGTALPTYRFAHIIDETEAGQYVVRVRVEQTDVPDDFKMLVPLRLEFGGGASGSVQLLVSGPLTEAELPPLAERPTKVELNPAGAVLADVKSAAWPTR